MEQGHRLLVSMKKTSDPACKAKLRAEAIASFQRGMSVTPDVERHAIAAMRRLGVTVIIAPYEADSQLAYLCSIGMCDAVLTEDSDIIVYSAICNRSFPILYKFNTSGSAQLIECNKIFKQHQVPVNTIGTETSGKRSKFLTSIKDFLGPSGRRMFVQMCVLAGCDYSDSVPGIGLQYSQQAVAQFRDVENDSRLESIVNFWNISGKKVPIGFLERVRRAELLFFYHLVYDPRTKAIVHFLPPRLQGSPGASSGTSVSPILSPDLIAVLGSADELLRPNGGCQPPSDATVADICEGRMCRVDFSPIYPILPWEYPELAALADHIPRTSMKSASWSLRRNLMTILKDQMQTKSPPNRNILPLKSRQKHVGAEKPSVETNIGRNSIFGNQPVMAKSLTNTAVSLSALRPKVKVTSPPKSKPERKSGYAQPHAGRNSSVKPTAGPLSPKASTFSSEQASEEPTVALQRVSPPPEHQRLLLSDITESEINKHNTVELGIDDPLSAANNSPCREATRNVADIPNLAVGVSTPQVSRTEVVAIEMTPSLPANHVRFDDTMWPANGSMLHSNSQHSISPLDKVVDLVASPISVADESVGNGEVRVGEKRKRQDLTMRPPSHPNFPSIVKINVDPRGQKRKKNGPVKTMNVASIRSFFTVSTSGSKHQ